MILRGDKKLIVELIKKAIEEQNTKRSVKEATKGEKLTDKAA